MLNVQFILDKGNHIYIIFPLTELPYPRSDILTAINYHASRLGFGSCFTESTCSAAVVLSTGFNSDVSHPIRKKHITNYEQNQQNISSHPGFKKPGIIAFVPKNIIGTPGGI